MLNDFDWKSYCSEYYKQKENERGEWERLHPIKKSRKEIQKEYQQSHKDKIKIHRKRYLKSVKGKLMFSRAMDYRRRNLGSILINDWFEDCERHHINENQIICIPKELHKQHRHNHKKSDTMIGINRMAFKYLTDTIKQL